MVVKGLTVKVPAVLLEKCMAHACVRGFQDVLYSGLYHIKLGDIPCQVVWGGFG